jgi:hypothetical protein
MIENIHKNQPQFKDRRRRRGQAGGLCTHTLVHSLYIQSVLKVLNLYIYACVYTAYSLPPCWQEGGKSEEWVEFDTPEILNQLFMPGPNHKSPPRYPQVACISNGPIFGEEGAEGGGGGGGGGVRPFTPLSNSF